MHLAYHSCVSNLHIIGPDVHLPQSGEDATCFRRVANVEKRSRHPGQMECGPPGHQKTHAVEEVRKETRGDKRGDKRGEKRRYKSKIPTTSR